MNHLSITTSVLFRVCLRKKDRSVFGRKQDRIKQKNAGATNKRRRGKVNPQETGTKCIISSQDEINKWGQL